MLCSVPWGQVTNVLLARQSGPILIDLWFMFQYLLLYNLVMAQNARLWNLKIWNAEENPYMHPSGERVKLSTYYFFLGVRWSVRCVRTMKLPFLGVWRKKKKLVIGSSMTIYCGLMCMRPWVSSTEEERKTSQEKRENRLRNTVQGGHNYISFVMVYYCQLLPFAISCYWISNHFL